MGDFYNLFNVFMIKFMEQYYNCNTEEFLLTLDNRFSNVSFITGTGVKILMDIFMLILIEAPLFNE